jgi:threonine synthase
MNVTHLECAACARRYEARRLHNLCTECGKPLLVRYDLAAASRTLTRESLKGRRADLWRYAEVLPVEREENIVSLGEGWTPLLTAERLGASLGLRHLYVKDESLNPTQSFKARGMTAAVSMAKELGARRLAVPSAGNAAGALAAYAARAGLEAHIFMPKDTPRANVVECEQTGAHVTLMDGLITDCGAEVARRKEAEGWFDVSTLKEPYRVEGKKTMGIEVIEQLGWQIPDAIVYPTGGGVGIIGMWKVFDELEQLGWIGAARPRLVSAQVAGGAVVKAFHEGADECLGAAHVDTIAPGIMVTKPFADFLILRALRATKGWAVGVPDAEMRAVMASVDRTEGLLLSPEGAATIAAVRTMVREGQLTSRSRVVVFNTATGLRYPHLLEGKVPTVAGNGTLDDAVVARAARAARGDE